ncbi:MAG: hypothetical protein ABI867_17685 [Kofleriaceae bacterium]
MRAILITVCALAPGCDGVLHEKVGAEIDAGVLGEIQAPPCDPPATPISDGHHNPGEDCLMCHHQGGQDNAPPFTFAGTLFDGAGGTQAVAGASVHLIDVLGTDVVVQSQSNGNFYATELLTFPVLAFTSQCPDVKPMLTPVREADGSCNASGCHTSGFRLH